MPRAPFDSRALLTNRLAAKWAECGGKKGEARISIETHYTEIGDFQVTLEIDDPAKYLCLQEAAWSLDLQPYPLEEKFRSWEIQL